MVCSISGMIIQLITLISSYSSHPYLFFNRDGYTMTFMGLQIDEDGNLKDINNKKEIEKQFMTKNLRKLMESNNLALMEEYNNWIK